MEDFTFFDFESRNWRSRMEDDEFAVNHSVSYKSVTFNQAISEEIIRSGLTKVRIRKDNITGDLHFVFNSENGSRITVTGKTRKNVVVANRSLVGFLVEQLRLDEDSARDVMHLSKNLANAGGYLTYKIMKKKT